MDPKGDTGSSTSADPCDGLPLAKLRSNLKAQTNQKGSSPFIVLLSTGSYCPVHLMHIEIFERAKKAFTQSGRTVIAGFISPTHAQHVDYKVQIPGKQTSIPGHHRLAMAQKAVEDSSWISASSWEVNQEYFVDFPDVFYHHQTVLQKQFGDKIELWYLCGEDHARKFGLNRGRFPCVAVARPGGGTFAQHQSKNFLFVSETTEDFSSTKVRNAMITGEPIENYVHPQVRGYIKENDISVRP